MTCAPSPSMLLIETVQVAVDCAGRMLGEQTTPERPGAEEEPTVTEVEAVTPFHAAETVTGVDVETVPAVAVNAADSEPAAIVTEAGTGNTDVELDVRITVAALWAAEVSVAVQVVVAPDATELGLHEMPDRVGVPPVTLIVPPAPATGHGSPAPVEPAGLNTLTVVLLERLGDSVRDTVATTPAGILVAFMPVATQV